MRSFPLATLLGLTVVLTGIIYQEYSERPVDRLMLISSPRQVIPELPRDMVAPSAGHDQGYVTKILARPLFSLSRRPVAPVEMASAAKAAWPRLTGVMVSNTLRTAIFAGPAEGKSLVVTDGGWVGRYRVRSISVGQVVLTGPDGETILRPTFAPAGSIATPTNSAPMSAPTMGVSDTGKPSVLDQLRLRGGGPSVGIPGLGAPTQRPSDTSVAGGTVAGSGR